MDYTHVFETALGRVTLASDGVSLTGLWFDGQKHFAAGLGKAREERDLPVFRESENWLEAYFGGEETMPAPKLGMRGTPFELAVWELLLTIPRGRTTTYGRLARAVARKMGAERASARAVGGAVGRNRISLIVPCHRVLGADGGLVGYAGGVERKEWLLRLEGADRRSFVDL